MARPSKQAPHADRLSPEQMAQLLWRETWPRKQLHSLECAGLLALRALGVSVEHMDAIDPIDGAVPPASMDEALALLRVLVDRSGLSPDGALHVFTAGLLAASVLADVFAPVQQHFVPGKGVKPQ